jgi:transcriptional regulator with XRE-family HTH domain
MGFDKSRVTGALIGKRIRVQRELLGFTQSQLAKKCKCPQTQIARWEAGVNIPSSMNLHRLATALTIKFEDLTAAHPDYKPAQDVAVLYKRLRKEDQLLTLQFILRLLNE